MIVQRGAAALGITIAIAVVAVAATFTASVVAAGPPCHATNAQTGVEYKGDSAVTNAIAAANAGDTIGIRGTCYGNFAISKTLTLQGEGKNATLDGNGGGRVLTLTSGTTTLRDLTITNGKTSSVGGGIYLAATAVLENVVVTENEAGATQFGGGIEADLGSRLTLIDSTVSGNTAGSSGGIDMFRARATLINSTVAGNHATRAPSPDPDGCGFGSLIYSCAGGIWNYQGWLALVDSTVNGNHAAYRGGGITSYLRIVSDVPVSGYTILAGRTSVRGNTAGDQGGGIYSNNAASVLAADGSASFTDPISGETLPAWTGTVSSNNPDDCSPTLTLGSNACGA
jgi:predicted outer membrane repeat protein